MKKLYLVILALFAIAGLGKLANNMSTGPTVTCSDIQKEGLYGKTVTLNGRVVSSHLTRNMTPVLVVKDEHGDLMNVALMPGSGSPVARIGYRYQFIGTPMSAANMACTWPNSVNRLDEYKLERTITRHIVNNRIDGTTTVVDAPNGWHNLHVWVNDKGQERLEVAE